MDPDSLLTPSFLIPVAGGAVVVLGIGIAVVRMMLGGKKKQLVDDWARGAYAIWTGGEDCAAWPAARAQQSLQSWYGIGASVAFWNTIRELRQGTTGNPAWDKVRALDLLRIGIASTIIDADQSRKEAAAIGGELQRQFRGWEELAQAFEAGMLEWYRGRGITDPQQVGRVQRNLPKLRQEIWPKVAWGASLVVDDD